MNEPTFPVKEGFDEQMAGKRAECDGGSAVEGRMYVGRQYFTGRLTGEYFDHGDPPWRWYLMVDLEEKPANYQWDSVWCESGNIYLFDE